MAQSLSQLYIHIIFHTKSNGTDMQGIQSVSRKKKPSGNILRNKKSIIRNSLLKTNILYFCRIMELNTTNGIYGTDILPLQGVLPDAPDTRGDTPCYDTTGFQPVYTCNPERVG
jgi:hypothetical protein